MKSPVSGVDAKCQKQITDASYTKEWEIHQKAADLKLFFAMRV